MHSAFESECFQPLMVYYSRKSTVNAQYSPSHCPMGDVSLSTYGTICLQKKTSGNLYSRAQFFKYYFLVQTYTYYRVESLKKNSPVTVQRTHFLQVSRCGCLVLACLVPDILHWLSCHVSHPSCPVHSVMFGPSCLSFLPWLSCPAFLLWLSCPGWLAPAGMFQLSRPSLLFPALQSSLILS